MTVLPFRILTVATATAALAACASGHGSAFTAQSLAQSQQASSDPQRSVQDGGGNGLAGVRGGSSGGGDALGGSRRGSSRGGRSIYVSGNVPVSGGGSGRAVSAGGGVSGASASAKVKAGGLKVAVKTDPLGGQVGKVKAGGATIALGDPLAGKGKVGLGQKGGATGVNSPAGKTVGSLIGQTTKGVDAGVGGLTDPVVGGKHKKPGN